jgi:hypothetical protein
MMGPYNLSQDAAIRCQEKTIKSHFHQWQVTHNKNQDMPLLDLQ